MHFDSVDATGFQPSTLTRHPILELLAPDRSPLNFYNVEIFIP